MLSDVELTQYLLRIIKSHQPLFMLDNNNLFSVRARDILKKHAISSSYEKKELLLQSFISQQYQNNVNNTLEAPWCNTSFISIQLPTTKSLQKGKKKSAVCAVLTKQLYSQSTEGQSPVLISGRPTQEWCQNQFVWLRASPPACNATAERVIRSVIPLQHPALWACPQGCRFTPGNQPCFARSHTAKSHSFTTALR